MVRWWSSQVIGECRPAGVKLHSAAHRERLSGEVDDVAADTGRFGGS